VPTLGENKEIVVGLMDYRMGNSNMSSSRYWLEVLNKSEVEEVGVSVSATAPESTAKPPLNYPATR
jgi:hypothetical protein